MKKLSYNSIKTGIKTLGGIGAMAFLASTPMNSYSQVQDTTKSDTTKKDSIPSYEDRIKAQKGILFMNDFEESEDSIKYTYPMNKYLQNAIKGAEEPYLILQGVKGKIKSNKENTELYVTIPKSELGKKGILGVGDRSSKYDPCDGKGLGSINTPLASFGTYFGTYSAKPEDFPTPEEPKEPEQPREGKLEKECCDETKIIDNSITNITNIYGDSTKTEKPVVEEKPCSDYRYLPEFAKYIAKPFSFIGGVIQRNLENNFWLGAYVRKNLGVKKTENQEDWNITTPLEPEISLETNSTGFERTTTKTERPYEGGLKLSYIPNNGILDIGLAFGAQQENNYTSTLKKGIDNISQNGKILDQKDFCVLTEEEKSQVNYLIMADLNANIFKGVSLGLEARVNDLFRKPNVEAAVKASIEFGGCKNRKSLIGGRK